MKPTVDVVEATDRIEPFRMAGNLYFVGTQSASSHLIVTEEGLILMDTGYPKTAAVVAESVEKLGFDIRDVKYIIHSHGHRDHVGGTTRILELAPDAKTMIGVHAANFAKQFSNITEDVVFVPDILLHDGDVVELGSTKILCLETPGHTPGTMSFFFDIEENGETLRVGTFGGASVNQIRYDRMMRENIPWNQRGAYFRSVQRLKKEHVDVFMANHAWQNQTRNYRAHLLATGENRFIDPMLWQEFLGKCEGGFEEMVKSESRAYFVNYAHRGASEYAPENTMMAFYLGLFMGANGIETDVRRTKDGVLVLFHDDTLMRMTGEEGAVEDYTYEELLQFSVAKGKLSDRIVKLEDFLKAFSHREITFAIELKGAGVAEGTADLLRQYNMKEKCVITSFKLEYLQEVKAYAPEFRVGYLTSNIDETVEKQLLALGADEICPRADNVTAQLVHRWHRMGFRVRAWGVADENLMKHVYDCYADGMTVNFPDKLQEYIQNK